MLKHIMSVHSNFWDPYCPCRVTRKNIVMACLVLCSFTLVSWTLIVTGNYVPIKKNINHVVIDQDKKVDNIKFKLFQSNYLKNLYLKIKKKQKEYEKYARKASEIAGNRKTALRVIKNLEDDIVSKCLCGLNVSPKDLYEAIENLKGDF